MKKNNEKYWRIRILVFVFIFGLITAAKTGNGWIALIACVGVPLLYIPYGISDWYRKKPPESPEKRPEPQKPVVSEVPVEKEKASEPQQDAKENTSAPQQDDVELHKDENSVVQRYAAESVKGDGNILESVRKTEQLEYPFRKVKYRQNISFKDIGKKYFYRDYIIKDLVTAEDGYDYVRDIHASCYDGANGRPVPSCSECYTGNGVEKYYYWLFDAYYPLPDEIDEAYDERFPPLSEKPDDPLKEKTFPLLGNFPNGKGDIVWMREREGQFEMIVEHCGVSPFDSGGCSDIVPDEVIGQHSLQALQDWMNAHSTPAFHKEIIAKESDYLRYLRKCGVCDEAESSQQIKSVQTKSEEDPVPAFSETDADDTPKYAEPDWEYLFQKGQAFCAADAATVSKFYRDPKTDLYYQTDIHGYVLISLTKEQVEAIQKKQA